MTLATGTRLGPYEVLSPIGKGGMGEVYRARDTRLGREVALKVLPPSLQEDPERRERLQQEARSISQLQHPNICALFDIGHENGTDFLVMELLEGETLAERLRRGPLPVREASSIAAKIASGIDRAHSRGIVHRDLKPGNVIITADGPKVLDFGLAKNVFPSGPPSIDSASPTALMTSAGTIVGTLQYMSPEQLQGKPIDARTDVFAFGCILFEMLTGKRPFDGDNQASIIAAILQGEPPPLESRLGNELPPMLKLIVDRCLAKNPDQRWQAMGDVHVLLANLGDGDVLGPSADGATRRTASRRWLAFSAAAIVPLLALAWFGGRSTAPESEPRPSPIGHFVIEAPELGPFDQITNPSVSADGRQVAFVGMTPDWKGVWIRDLSELVSRPVEGPENAGWVTFSPDGEWLAYLDVVTRKVLKVSVHGGRPTVVADPGYIPFDWAADGFIYYPPRSQFEATTPEQAGLARIRPDGGEPEQLTLAEEVDESGGRLMHTSPQLLPGSRLLFSVGRGFLAEGWDTAVLDLASGEWRRVFEGANQASYFDGHLVFWRDGRIWAVPYDLDRLETTGTARPVTDGVSQHPTAPLEVGQFQFGADGSMVYLTGGTSGGSEGTILRLDENGSTEMARNRGSLGWPRISPDGGRVAVDRCFTEPPQGFRCRVWIYDLETGSWFAIGSPDSETASAAWDPGGESLLVSERTPEGRQELVRHSLAPGENPETLLSISDGTIVPIGTASDGRILFTRVAENVKAGVWTLSSNGEPSPLMVNDEFGNIATDLSTDGRWLIFDSDRSGRYEIYALDLEAPGSSPKRLVTEGGRFAVLSPSQDVLYWRSPSYPGAAEILRADVDLEQARVGEVTVLSETRSVNTNGWFSLGGLDASEDGLWAVGREFHDAGSRAVLVRNWGEDIRRKLARE